MPPRKGIEGQEPGLTRRAARTLFREVLSRVPKDDVFALVFCRGQDGTDLEIISNVDTKGHIVQVLMHGASRLEQDAKNVEVTLVGKNNGE